MNLSTVLKAFSLFAVAVMVSSSLAGAAETSIVTGDAERRTERFTDAMQDVRKGKMEAVPEARAALADAPDALLSSPGIQELDAVLTSLDNPIAAQLMAPLLASGALEGSPEEIAERAAGMEAQLQNVTASIGLDTERLAPEWNALLAATADLDTSDPTKLEAQLRAMPPETLEGISASLAQFTAAWSADSHTELAERMDELARTMQAAPAEGIQGRGELDAEQLARYRETIDMLDAMRAELHPESFLGADVQASYDPALWQEQRAAAQANITALFASLGVTEDAFLGDPLARQPSFPSEPTGLVAVDGVPVQGAPPASADALLAPLPEPAPSVEDLLQAPPVAPLDPLAMPLTSHADVAHDLGLPGARGVDFDQDAFDNAHDKEVGDAPDGIVVGAPLIQPHVFDLAGHVGGVDDPSDVYTMHIDPDRLLRVFLMVPESANADLEVYCADTGRSWASWSDATSDRPSFDSVTFVVNSVGVAQNEVFSDDEFDADSTCASGNFYLIVDAASPGETPYLIQGNAIYYDGHQCAASSWDSASCGLNWVRWGDRCKDDDAKCLDTQPSVSNAVYDAAVGRDWSSLSADAQQPVVFVHGVGDLEYNTFVDMENHYYHWLFSVEGVAIMKMIVFAITSGVIVWGTINFLMCVQTLAMLFATSGSLAGAMVGLFLMTLAMASWSNTVTSMFKMMYTVMSYWRIGSWDVGSHFWNLRDSGFETYWIEYNSGDNHAMEERRHIQRAGWEIKFAVSAIQQDFFDRHRFDVGFPYASPEDVKVDLVVHSMGGLTTRFYTAERGVDMFGDLQPNVRERSYTSSLYEADVNKWISLQTPNMGSTIAKQQYANSRNPITIGDLFWLMLGIALSACGMGIGTWGIIGKLVVWAVQNIAIPLKAYFDLKKRDQLIPGMTPVVDHLNAQPVAPDIDYGIIWGRAFPGFDGNKPYDILVAENDAKGPPQLLARMATYPIPDDHAAALFSGPALDKLRQWLRNPDGAPFAQTSALVSAAALPAEEGGWVKAAAAPAGTSLLATFGQVDGATVEAEPGAKYTPDGGALSTAAPGRLDDSATGDRAAKLGRLAIVRGYSDAAQTFAEADASARNALGEARSDPTNGTAIVNSSAQAAAGRLAAATPRASLDQLAPDIAILRAGHVTDAQTLLEAIGEPSVVLSPTAPQSQFAQRDILLLPTGALSGASADLTTTIERFVREGGTVVAFAQARGADLAALPARPEGFGFAEEDAAYRDSVVFGTFTPALAGQADASPDLSVDGSLTKLPADATIELRSAKNGRAVLASYPYGDGHVVVSSLLPDWARGASRASADELALVRDLVADVRAPSAVSLGAPGAPATIDVDLGAVAAGASAVTLVLVDDGARETRRETFDLAAGSALSWAIPENVTRARHYSLDAILRNETGDPTSKLLDVRALYASHFSANPGGFRPTFAAAALDVTSATDRIETGGDLAFDLVVTNLKDEPQTVTVGYWLPAHATLTGDLATYGAGAPREGAAAAWDDNFQLRTTITLPAGSTTTLGRALTGVQRSDAVTARLYAEDGTVLGEARRAFTAYVPTVALALAADSPHYAPGGAIALTVSARDTAAAATAGARVATLAATLRGPDGAAVSTASGSVLVGPTSHDATLMLSVPAGAPVGAYVASVEARFGLQRIASAALTTRVPGAQLAATPTLPASFAAGAASIVTYTVRDPGPQPVDAATFEVRLVAPDGATEWTGSAPLSLAPGESSTLSFDVTPATATPGVYTLAYRSVVDGVEFAGETPLRSDASIAISLARTSFRARDTFGATVRVVNDGRFELPLVASASVAGIANAGASQTLAPGASLTLPLAGEVPADVPAGSHAITVALTLPNGARTVTRSFTVPPARLALTPPAASTAAAGDALAATLANTGGVDALVPWAARLADASGRVVAVASGEALVLAGAEANVGLGVPAQAATGTYTLFLSADTGDGKPATATRSLTLAGVSGTLTFSAPATTAPGAAIGLSATPTPTGAPLSGATLELTAIRPTPLPAWTPLGSVDGTSAAEFGGARWFGTDAGLVRIDEATGASTTITTANGLPSNRVAALTVARGTLYAGTDRGLAWLDGASWSALTTLGPLPTKNVRALAGNDNDVFLLTDAGIGRFDGITVSAVALPTSSARAVAADDAALWVALADVTTGFAGIDAQPITKTGTSTANPSVAVAPDGDIHVIYADNQTGSANARLLHVHLSAEGALISGPHVIRDGANGVALTGLAADSAGALHAVWEDYRTAGDADVYYRKIGADGQLLSDEIAIGQHGGSSQRWARVAVGPDDVVVVAWADDRDPNPPGATTSRGSELYFAKVSPDGTLLLPQTRLSFSSGNVLIPRIALDAQGNIHAAYTDRVKRCDPEFPQYCYDNLETFYQKWDIDGQQLVAPKIVSAQDDTISYLPGIGIERDGGASILYQELGQNGGMRLARVSSTGEILTSHVRVSPLSVVRPQLLPRADGLFDVFWTDYHTGKSEAWHNVLSPDDERLTLAQSERINAPGAPGDGSQVVNGFAMSVASSATGRAYAAWDDQRNASAPQWRVASTDTRYTGKGVARIDLATAGAPALFTRANGALPSDDVLGLDVEGDLAAFATSDAVTFRDARTGALDTVAAPGADGAVALHRGRAYLASAQHGLVADPETRDVRPIEAGGPQPLALASAAKGLLVAGPDAAALLVDDREDRFGTQRVPATDGAASTGTIGAPLEQGRYRVRATLLSETEQPLAVAERDVHVVDGALAITISPSTTLAALGEPVTITVGVGNRGATDLRAVHATLAAGGASILDQTLDLRAGEARTFVVTRSARTSYDLVATAAGRPASLAAGSAEIVSTATDHVEISAPAITARILAPAVATRAPFAVDALVVNDGALPLDLTIALDDGAPRALSLPPRSRAVVEGIATVSVLSDRTLRLAVEGDAKATAEALVRAGDRTLLSARAGLAGAPGERTVTLTFTNVGPLASEAPLTLALDGAPVPGADLALAPGASASLDVALDLDEGLHTLAFATPWESGQMRLVASDAAVPIVALDAPTIAAGAVTAAARVENAGPGRLVGALEIDLGNKVESFDVDLVEGATFDATSTGALAGAAPGPAVARATFVRDGAAVAQAERAFDVPGPRLAFVTTPGSLTANAGESVILSYTVENVGEATGPADLAVSVAGVDALAKTLVLAPGERATVELGTRVEPDARDGALAVVARVPGAQDVASIAVAGARVDATGAMDAPSYEQGSTATLALDLANGANAADLVVRARLGMSEATATLSLAAGERRAVALPLVASESGEAAWTVALASGRVLSQGATRVLVDTLATTGIRVTSDVAELAAGGVVTFNVTTSQEGRVDLIGPGFRDAFDLNGTQERSYVVPEPVRAGRYTTLYTFDATNASGTLPLAVRGQDVASRGFALDKESASPPELVQASWTIDASVAGAAIVRAWAADATGAAGPAVAYTTTLVPGPNALLVDVPLADLEPGAATVFATLSLPGAAQDDTLAQASAGLLVRGFAVRDARIELGDERAYDVVVDLQATPGMAADVVARTKNGQEVALAPQVDGRQTYALPFVAPEGGTYAIDVRVVAGAAEFRRSLTATVPGAGAPPTTSVTVDGPTWLRDDGVLVMSREARLMVVAVDAESGVASTSVVDDEGVAIGEDGRFPAGLHDLTYSSRDHAGHKEADRTLRILVDGDAPELALAHPAPGEIHVAGALVREPPGLAIALPLSALPALPPQVLDTDGDGFTDAEETVDGSDVNDSASTPARFMPAPPPPSFEKPVVVLGALRVQATATDEGAGLRRIVAILDDAEVASTTSGVADWTIDLSSYAAGDHVLTILTDDLVGNARSVTMRIQLVPTGLEGVAATDATAPRLHPWAPAMSSWLADAAAALPDALQQEELRREARAEALEAQLDREVVQPLTPLAIDELPEQLQRDLDATMQAVEEIVECCVTG